MDISCLLSLKQVTCSNKAEKARKNMFLRENKMILMTTGFSRENSHVNSRFHVRKIIVATVRSLREKGFARQQKVPREKKNLMITTGSSREKKKENRDVTNTLLTWQ